jgi:hypothetical protein
MHIVGSLSQVNIDSFGDVIFGLYISNKGTAPFDCTALRATQIPTKGASKRVPAQNPERCTGAGHKITSGSRAWVSFFVPGNGHAPKDIVVLPYGSNVGRIVWSVAGCPTGPTPCLGPSGQSQG